MAPNRGLSSAELHVLLLVIGLGLLRTAESHGFLLQPMGRSFVSYKFDPDGQKDYNPQGANAGGKAKVHDNGRLHWSAGRFGMCGDAFDAPVKRLEQPGRTTASYSPGTTITIHLLITANHWGRMEFSLCPRNATSADYKQRCTLLQRQDGRGPHWTLPPGELPDPQGRPLVPSYSDSSFSYYIYPENDDFRQTPVFVPKYKLPAGVTCDACVLRWYWLTGNSCNPPCEASDPLYPKCDRLQMGYCDNPKALSPEEFWGCSDIRISNKPARSPHINSSLDALSDRLAAAQEAQDRVGRPQLPALPHLADYWRPELLAANEKLDETYTNHNHHSRRQQRRQDRRAAAAAAAAAGVAGAADGGEGGVAAAQQAAGVDAADDGASGREALAAFQQMAAGEGGEQSA